MRMYNAVLATIAGAAATLAVAGPAAAIGPGTRCNVLDAMHGEAFAFARYSAFAVAAHHAGYHEAAALFEATAKTERDEHFPEEAELVTLVRKPAANLMIAIDEKSREASRWYPTYARQAESADDQAAASLFWKLAEDETRLLSTLRRAAAALNSGTPYPEPPETTPVEIVPGKPQSRGATLENLRSTMRDEAFTSAKYTLYAKAAYDQGHERLGALFAALSDIAWRQHFAAAANLAGLVGTTAENLRASIAGENHEATVMYPQYSEAAYALDDTAAGDRLAEIAGDEGRHRDAFQKALDDLG